VSADEVIGLVFDLPDERWTAEIRRLRGAYDRDRSGFPVEITVVGSSGLGWFSPNQTPDVIAEKVRDLTQNLAPFKCFFSKVESFAESHVYYLALKNEEPFQIFQRVLAESPLKFESTPFPYKPHCTIVALPNAASSTAHAEVAAFPVPRHAVTICSAALYSVNNSRNVCRLIERFPLGA